MQGTQEITAGSAIIFVFIVRISQLLNKFPGARSYQHFSCFVYPLTTVLIFAVRRITPRNLLDVLRAAERKQYETTEKRKAQWEEGDRGKNKRAPDQR